ncbi:hypothetical protein [Clostridium peptidivorans]|uniref:hypothetical protein n=1 Tax=Clostridium peptidivorans TaxID=100174 RepID=UPI0015C7D0E1|nr:hypothetical protein [Clostridium peptidivorans]
MNQVYKKENYVIIPVEENYIVINIEKAFKNGHTHIGDFSKAKLLIDLAIKKKLPKNYKLVDSLERISNNKEYIDKLIAFKEESNINFAELMQGEHVYKRIKGAIKQIK